MGFKKWFKIIYTTVSSDYAIWLDKRHSKCVDIEYNRTGIFIDISLRCAGVLITVNWHYISCQLVLDCGKLHRKDRHISTNYIWLKWWMVRLRGGWREGERQGYISANQVCWLDSAGLEKSKKEANTAVQKVSDAGLEAREIMAVTGHRWDAFDS